LVEALWRGWTVTCLVAENGDRAIDSDSTLNALKLQVYEIWQVEKDRVSRKPTI
jgi:hypothetical protein